MFTDQDILSDILSNDSQSVSGDTSDVQNVSKKY